MKYIHGFLIVCQLLFLNVSGLPAQNMDEVVNMKASYAILLDRFKVFMEYYKVSEEVRNLYNEALGYAASEDYEIASVLLEEAMSLLKSNPSDTDSLEIDYTVVFTGDDKTGTEFKIGLLSGIDYNSQEFELGFLENDSIAVEEFNKPFIGISTRFYSVFTGQAGIEVYNSLRYDKENLRDDYKIRWQTDPDFYIQYGGYWNETNSSELSSYWDQLLSLRIRNPISSNLSLTLFNNFNYKSYRTFSTYLRDYYRNRFDGIFEWRTPLLGMTRIEYINEFNETLGHKDNDFIQHDIRIGVSNDQISTYFYNFVIDAGIRDYSIQFDDSLIQNQYKSLVVEATYEISVHRNFKLTFEENFINKIYQSKSSLEPDYYWNYMRPGMRFQFLNNFEIGTGYEWEFKEHISNPLYEYNVNEQNYNSNGIFLSLNYFSASGLYISSSLSYQWRRYPHSITNDLISIYSNQNIFSIMLIAYLPINEHLFISSFVTYDNDQDIDFDQQNNRSTIFTLEFEYIL